MSDFAINDLFWTVQGEGANTGRRALFVRMPSCNLACSWCDTDFAKANKVTLKQFQEFAAREPARLAVVTGGEPMMHRHTARVVQELKALGFEVACETNGNFPIVPGVDFVTCSPKKDTERKYGAPYYVHPSVFSLVHEWKYVVDSGFDWSTLGRHCDVPANVRLSLSPEFSAFRERVGEILEYIRYHPRWRLSLQTHKWIEVP